MTNYLAYSLQAETTEPTEAFDRFDQYMKMTSAWVDRKAKDRFDFTGDSEPLSLKTIILRDGREGTLSLSVDSLTHDDQAHKLLSLELTHPYGDSGSTIRTDLKIASGNNRLVLSARCQLIAEVIADQYAVTPRPGLDLKCPRIVREIGTAHQWKAGNTSVQGNHSVYFGDTGALLLQESIWDESRTLPIVVISSNNYPSPFPPDRVLRSFQDDLFGVAHVAHLDVAGAWELSDLVGREWSCFSGAIRIYWPIRPGTDEPQFHRYWPHHVKLWGKEAEDALDNTQREIKTAIFAEAATLPDPQIIQSVTEAYKSERLENLQGEEWINYLEDENKKLEAQIIQLKESHGEELRRIQQELSEKSNSQNDLQDRCDSLLEELDQVRSERDQKKAPDHSPKSVSEAIDIANREYKRLAFGMDVDDGVKGLDPSAGPPKKILRTFMVLDKYAATMIELNGNIGKRTIDWFSEQGVNVAPESSGVRKSDTRRQKRTFRNPASKDIDVYDLHARLGGGSANRVVRIYFRYDRNEKKTVIGWVGQKPELD